MTLGWVFSVYKSPSRYEPLGPNLYSAGIVGVAPARAPVYESVPAIALNWGPDALPQGPNVQTTIVEKYLYADLYVAEYVSLSVYRSAPKSKFLRHDRPEYFPIVDCWVSLYYFLHLWEISSFSLILLILFTPPPIRVLIYTRS